MGYGNGSRNIYRKKSRSSCTAIPAAPTLFRRHLQYCQKIPKTDSKFPHIERLSGEAWASKDTKFLTPSLQQQSEFYFIFIFISGFFKTKLII